MAAFFAKTWRLSGDLFDGDSVGTRLVSPYAAWLRASNNPRQVL
jgi:hypothetical protein